MSDASPRRAAEVLGTVQTCSRCHRRRTINAHWQDTGYMLCRMCSVRPGVAFAASVRSMDFKVERHA